MNLQIDWRNNGTRRVVEYQIFKIRIALNRVIPNDKYYLLPDRWSDSATIVRIYEDAYRTVL